jgi:hypothetical protein
MNRPFDFYEYVGFIVPGAILCLGLLWLFPEGRALFGKEGVTFGELGLFVIVAYAAGQLIQGIGNALEWIFWKPFGGMPSAQVFDGELLSADQRPRMLDALRNLSPSQQDLTKLQQKERRAIVREVYTKVSIAGQAVRVDTFVGNYGLARGLAASFVVLLASAMVTMRWTIAAVITVMLLLALQRMYRFGRHYAVELFMRYLALPSKGASIENNR